MTRGGKDSDGHCGKEGGSKEGQASKKRCPQLDPPFQPVFPFACSNVSSLDNDNSVLNESNSDRRHRHEGESKAGCAIRLKHPQLDSPYHASTASHPSLYLGSSASSEVFNDGPVRLDTPESLSVNSTQLLSDKNRISRDVCEYEKDDLGYLVGTDHIRSCMFFPSGKDCNSYSHNCGSPKASPPQPPAVANATPSIVDGSYARRR